MSYAHNHTQTQRMKTKRHNPGENQFHKHTHRLTQNANKTTRWANSSLVLILNFMYSKDKKNKQIYENYKIHVIFAYYYKTILLSFIKTKRKQERDTHNKNKTTHKHAKSDTPKGWNEPLHQTFTRDSHFPLQNNSASLLFANQTRSIYRTTQKFTPNARNANVIVIFTLEKTKFAKKS